MEEKVHYYRGCDCTKALGLLDRQYNGMIITRQSNGEELIRLLGSRCFCGYLGHQKKKVDYLGVLCCEELSDYKKGEVEEEIQW